MNDRCFLDTMQISKSTRFSYWDSLILAMAIDTGCSTLYSEDLNNRQEIEGVKIVNPFFLKSARQYNFQT